MSITLTVQYKGTQCTVTIDPKEKVSHLMDQVKDFCGFHGIDQVMEFDGIKLSPFQKLNIYGVRDGDTINLSKRDDKGFDYDVRIHRGDAIVGNVGGGSSSSSSSDEDDE